jgi:hypothetical protein
MKPRLRANKPMAVPKQAPEEIQVIPPVLYKHLSIQSFKVLKNK